LQVILLIIIKVIIIIIIGNASSNHLKFFIASVGDWTNDLHNIVSDPVKRDKTIVMVQGPFKAPAGKLFRHYHVVRESVCLIASGIGITPFLSCIATNIMNAINSECNQDTLEFIFPKEKDIPPTLISSESMKISTDEEVEETENLKIIWSIREVSELMFFIDYLHPLIKLQDQLRDKVVSIDIYLTGLGSNKDPSKLISQTFFLLIAGERETESMNIIYSRPDYDDIIKTVNPSSIYYCGGKAIKEMLYPICQKYKIKFRPESFDAGGSYYNQMKNYISKVFGKYFLSSE